MSAFDITGNMEETTFDITNHLEATAVTKQISEKSIETVEISVSFVKNAEFRRFNSANA